MAAQCSWAAPHELLLKTLTVATAAAAVAMCYFLVRYCVLKKTKAAVRLRSPPGPPGLPILGNLHMLGALPHRSLAGLAAEYGPIMSLKLGLVPAVVASSPRTAELFLNAHDHGFARRPSGDVGKYNGYGRKGLVLAEYGDYWRGTRKLCTVHLLCSRKVEAFRPVRSEEVRRFVGSIKDVAAEDRVPVDLSARVAALITDVACRTLFGRKYEEAWRLEKIIKDSLVLAGAFNAADYLPWVGFLDVQGIRRRLKAVGKAYDGLLEAVIEEHALRLREGKKLEEDFDVVDTMLCAMGSDEYGDILRDRSDVKAILMDLVNGAFDTTHATVEWTMSELLRHPRVMKKLRAELEDAVGMHRMVEEEDLANVSYLGMVIKETMRLHPTIPIVPREAGEDCDAGGFHISEGTRVLVNVWAIGRDPSLWADADAFLPERFAGDVGSHGLAFGAGRRRCPGMQFALTLVRIVVAQLVHCFDWEIPGGGELDMAESFGVVVSRTNHLCAVPTYRLRGGQA